MVREVDGSLIGSLMSTSKIGESDSLVRAIDVYMVIKDPILLTLVMYRSSTL